MPSHLPLAEAGQAAGAFLRGVLTCAVLLPGSAEYESCIRIWNCAISTQPAIVVVCRSASDVQQAVRAAGSFGLPLSVRGGGYDIHGRALCSGMVVSMHAMRHVTVDTARDTVTFEGGCTMGDVARAVSAYQRAIVSGTVADVGMTGWTLGGGYGQLNSRYGLGVDNVLSAELVLADGSLLTAGQAMEPNNAELLWCLQGGGGGLGVVTSMTCRTQPVSEVLAGAIVFPIEQAKPVLQRYQQLIYEQPDELGCMFFFVSGPGGAPMLILSPFWSGSTDEGREHVQRFEQLGKPMMSQIGPMPWVDTFKATEGKFPPGRASWSDCRCISSLTDEAIDVLIEAARKLPSPHSAIICHDLHGAAARVPVTATAYPIRQPHLLIELVSIEETATVSDTAREWVHSLSSALAPHSLPQSWPQLVGRTADDQQRTRQTYRDNMPRLAAMKQKVDPHNLFASTVVPL